MKLSISATLTDEEAVILAKSKGWADILSTRVLDEQGEPTGEVLEVPNTLDDAKQFIVSVYQSMIISDVTNIFTEYRTQQLKEQIKQTEQIVKTDIENAIISSIE